MKNSNHASKALAVVLSGALAFAPAANAALDESNMAYTAASEGFYGSLRVQFENNDAAGGKNNDSEVAADDSRLGVGGSADLGGGLEAFYGFEWNLGDAENNGGGLKTRQHHVGLRGDWGSVWLGAFDSVIVRFGGFATTDILDQYSGNFEPIYRTSNALAYVSPDLNGFQFGVEVQAKDNEKGKAVVLRRRILNGGNPFDCEDAFNGEPNPAKHVPAKPRIPAKYNVVPINGDDALIGDLDRNAFAVEQLVREGTTVTVYNVITTNGDDLSGDLDLSTLLTVETTAATPEEAAKCAGNTAEVAAVADDGNDFDSVGIGASYSIQGLTFSGAYYQQPDALVFGYNKGLTADTNAGVRANAKDLRDRANALNGNTPVVSSEKTDDKGQYALGISYSQDNWIVAGMYGGEDVTITECADEAAANTPNNQCDVFRSKSGDATFFSLAGGVSIDKLDIHGLWEQKTYENAYQQDDVEREGGLSSFDREQTITAISARYHLGSKARLRAAWKNTETDEGNLSNDVTNYALGMRVDF